jgi:hypothetical protein
VTHPCRYGVYTPACHTTNTCRLITNQSSPSPLVCPTLPHIPCHVCTHLQALTTFCRSNWQTEQVETFDVQLQRDAKLGLGITVAGYVHRKGNVCEGFTCNYLSRKRSGQLSRVRRTFSLRLLKVCASSVRACVHTTAAKHPYLKFRHMPCHTGTVANTCTCVNPHILQKKYRACS